MAVDRSVIYSAAMGQYQSQLIDAQAQFAKADLDGDEVSAMHASQDMARIRREAAEYAQMAREDAAAIASAPREHPNGLTPEMQEAARISGVTDDEYARGFENAVSKRRFTWQNGMGDGKS